MNVHGGDQPSGWRLVAYAAGCVASRYGITIDEATHALHFESCLLGISLETTARLTVATQGLGEAIERPPPDEPASGAATRATRRWEPRRTGSEDEGAPSCRWPAQRPGGSTV